MCMSTNSFFAVADIESVNIMEVKQAAAKQVQSPHFGSIAEAFGLHSFMSSARNIQSTALQDEISALTKLFTDCNIQTTERLKRLAFLVEKEQNKFEARLAEQESRIAELEAKNSELFISVKWLRHLNEELERKEANHKAELDHALEARESAFRKLKHIRKVARDLLDERVTSPPKQKILDEALHDDLYAEDSPTTATVQSYRAASQVLSQTSNTDEFRAPSPTSLCASWKGGSDTFESPFPKTLRDLAPQSSEWYLHFHSMPPGCSNLILGPIPWTKLVDHFGLTEDEMSSLESLQNSPQLGMRVQITTCHIQDETYSLGFIYDPIFFETPTTTYLLDWAPKTVNRKIRKYVTASRPDTVVHTFTCMGDQRGWFYIGAQQWQVAKLDSLWPIDDRDDIIAKLQQRTRGQVSEPEIAKGLDDKDLTQLCVEINSGSLRESTKFAGRADLLHYNPVTPVRGLPAR